MWIIYLFFCGCGAPFITLTLARIIQMKRCTEIVDGWFLDTFTMLSEIKAKFFYVYNGKEYYGLTDLGISKKRMNEFSKSCKYTLFVNPKKPHKFAYDKKLTLGNEIIPLVGGILITLVPVAFEIWLGIFRL